MVLSVHRCKVTPGGSNSGRKLTRTLRAAVVEFPLCNVGHRSQQFVSVGPENNLASTGPGYLS